MGEMALFFAIPAVGADLVPVQADGLEQAVKRLITERTKAKVLTNPAQHTPVSYTHLDVYKRQVFPFT